MIKFLGCSKSSPQQLVSRNTAGQAQPFGQVIRSVPSTWGAQAEVNSAKAICYEGTKTCGLRNPRDEGESRGS